MPKKRKNNFGKKAGQEIMRWLFWLFIAGLFFGAGVIITVNSDYQSFYHLPKWVDVLMMFFAGLFSLRLTYLFKKQRDAQETQE